MTLQCGSDGQLLCFPTTGSLQARCGCGRGWSDDFSGSLHSDWDLGDWQLHSDGYIHAAGNAGSASRSTSKGCASTAAFEGQIYLDTYQATTFYIRFQANHDCWPYMEIRMHMPYSNVMSDWWIELYDVVAPGASNFIASDLAGNRLKHREWSGFSCSYSGGNMTVTTSSPHFGDGTWYDGSAGSAYSDYIGALIRFQATTNPYYHTRLDDLEMTYTHYDP